MRYKAIFIDIDDTLLDYVPCCREAFDEAMKVLSTEYGIQSTDQITQDQLFELFFGISGRLFSEAKRGLHTIAEVMELYPREFVERMSELADDRVRNLEMEQRTDTFKHAFRAAWGETHTLVDGAKECLEALQHKGYRLFAASNSFGHLQRSRLERAGILDYFENTYISMDIGYDKPDIRFYEHALRACGLAANEVLMVGDSMTTDIVGAKKAGLGTCFFNRRPEEKSAEKVADYEIRSLSELLAIL